MTTLAKERAERLFHRKVEGGKVVTDYQAKEAAFRVLNAKLRAERLERESNDKAQIKV
jgi:hypothetical protein